MLKFEEKIKFVSASYRLAESNKKFPSKIPNSEQNS